MPFTRAQATSLLNQAEMGLFDDSRANGLRGLSTGELGKRIERARKARDRARDLLQRQKLASRARTGSKRGASGQANQRSRRKAELLADILKRFETQMKPATLREKREGARPAAKRSASARRPSPAKAAVERGKSAAAAPRKAVRRVASASSSRNKSATTQRSTGKSATRRKITPKQALANTRRLLEAKQANDRQPQPWQTLDPQNAHVPQSSYQSDEAADKAQELHAGESRMVSIQGSISTRDRKNQGKRDHRGDPE